MSHKPLSRSNEPRMLEGGHAGGLRDAIFDRLLQERIIFLGREVDDEIANSLAAQMLLLSAEDAKRDIHLYINSPGGSVSAGMAIYDTMRFVDCDVATYGMGLAASMGQFLLSAGTPGKRYALPHTRVMMHQPSAGVSGQPVEQFERDSDRDRWFSPEEALAYGLVDHVVAHAAALPVRDTPFVD
jgi:ATP-dependent Clp protease protease subunit